MTEMVRRAATAVRAALVREAASASENVSCEAIARAVLEALREPTEEMVEAGVHSDIWNGVPVIARTVRLAWEEMIDAAIGGK